MKKIKSKNFGEMVEFEFVWRIAPIVAYLITHQDAITFKHLLDTSETISSVKVKRGNKIKKIKSVLFNRLKLDINIIKEKTNDFYSIIINDSIANEVLIIIKNMIPHSNNVPNMKNYIKKELSKYVKYE